MHVNLARCRATCFVPVLCCAVLHVYLYSAGQAPHSPPAANKQQATSNECMVSQAATLCVENEEEKRGKSQSGETVRQHSSFSML